MFYLFNYHEHRTAQQKKAIRLVYPWTGHTGLALSSNVSQLKLSLNYLILNYLFLLYADFRIG